MKAWRVDDTTDLWAYVLAESPGKAKSAFVAEFDELTGEWESWNWRGLRCRRQPLLDGESITERQLVDGGLMWIECGSCHWARIENDGDHGQWVWTPSGYPLCEDCARANRDPKLPAPGPALSPQTCILLWAD